MIYAEVAVPVPSRVGALFTYSVPPTMAVESGDIVAVPFASRVLPAIVVRCNTTPPDLPTREMLSKVEGAPSISAERVDVALWIARYYRASLFDALSLFLPPGWQDAIADRGSPPSSWIFRWLAPPICEDTVVAAVENPGGTQTESRSSRAVRARVLAALRARGAAQARIVSAEARCSLATIRRMLAEGLLVEIADASRGDDAALRAEQKGQITLSKAQADAFAPIAEAVEQHRHQVFLLHGVTGSGKTQIYLRLIELLVQTGRRAIVMVSEIAQTPEALEQYSERFPGKVAVLHSELPLSVRWHLWRRVYDGHFNVVVGPRSAIFAPVPGLGLVVLDEEHEPAYKQDDRSPRFHARDVAIELGKRMGAPVVLGSATPDVVTYHLAERGIYHLASLPDRYCGPSAHGWSSGRLPKVQIVDMREELRAGNTGILSRELRSGLEQTLAAGEQAILFLNRRGAYTSVLCRDCGHVLKCRRCDAPLIYHKDSNDLVCHLCNRRISVVSRCPSCKGTRIAFFGIGTERVEEEVRKLFPQARVIRWDRDVTGPRDAHARIYQQFQDHEADILVGTQMVAKALDFPLVTLVGVVLADVTLYLPDFRAAERSFQLLSQVAGRAGRGSSEGKVVIQTYSPDHYSVLAASHHDYRAFYEQELAFRRYHSYPPFRRLARLLLSSSGEARARVEAIEMRKRLQVKIDEIGIGDVEVIGPAPAFHSRVRSRFRWQIVLAGEGLVRLLEEITLPLEWAVDVDPMSLL